MSGRWHSRLREINGAFGDMGTFLPYVVGAVTVGGLGAAGVLFGFALMLIGTGLFYGLPLAVQPMKAVSATLLTSGLSAEEVAMAGLMLGAIFLLLGLTGGISWLARVIPNSVTLGLVLGLGLAMMWLGGELMLETPWLGLVSLLFLWAASRFTRFPLLAMAVLTLLLAPYLVPGLVEEVPALGAALTLPAPVWPSWSDLPRALERAVLPQLPLTLSNAIIATAAVSASLFVEGERRVSTRRLSLTTGVGNLLLAPLGAMPMCHGAGGVVAQARFGARTGMAPLFLGVLMLLAALFVGNAAADVLAVFPLAAAGALLVVAGYELAFSRRLFEARRSCWPVIGVTAAVAFFNPALGLLGGLLMEFVGRRYRRLP